VGGSNQATGTFAVPDWAAGVDVVVHGQVKRRFYRGPSGTQSRTEVVATEVCEATKRRQVQRLLAHAVDALGAS